MALRNDSERPLRKPARNTDRRELEDKTMNTMNLIKDNKGLWLAVACAVSAFGLLNIVLGSQPQERTGTVTITQLLDDDMGSMVVEATRPSDSRVASSDRSVAKHGRKGETAIELAVGF